MAKNNLRSVSCFPLSKNQICLKGSVISKRRSSESIVGWGVFFLPKNCAIADREGKDSWVCFVVLHQLQTSCDDLTVYCIQLIPKYSFIC